MFREVERVQVAALGEGHLHVAMTRRNMGRSLLNLDRHDEAVAALEAGLSSWIEAMGDEGFFPPEVRLDLATARNALGDHAVADALVGVVLQGYEVTPPRAGAWGHALLVHARLLGARGQHRDAVNALRQALDRHDADGIGEETLERARVQSELGHVLTELGAFAEAGDLLERAHATLLVLRGAESLDTKLARERRLRLDPRVGG
jgi:tetratricopeptide (TPR) repeat protein